MPYAAFHSFWPSPFALVLGGRTRFRRSRDRGGARRADGGETGQVLWSKDATTTVASLLPEQAVTLELLFPALKDGRVKLADAFRSSQRAWSNAGLEGFWRDRRAHSVETPDPRHHINRIANDMCVVVPRSLGGSSKAFAT